MAGRWATRRTIAFASYFSALNFFALFRSRKMGKPWLSVTIRSSRKSSIIWSSSSFPFSRRSMSSFGGSPVSGRSSHLGSCSSLCVLVYLLGCFSSSQRPSICLSFPVFWLKSLLGLMVVFLCLPASRSASSWVSCSTEQRQFHPLGG